MKIKIQITDTSIQLQQNTLFVHYLCFSKKYKLITAFVGNLGNSKDLELLNYKIFRTYNRAKCLLLSIGVYL